MQIEDAVEQVRTALKLLIGRRRELGLEKLRIRDLKEFEEEAAARRLSPAGRETIVEQAIVLIEQLYAHLPFKRARYAINPVQKLRLLRHQLSELSDRDFHGQLVDAFVGLRDAHTQYGLPVPYKNNVAFLPFQMACYGAGAQRRFVVTRVLEGFDHPSFGPGAELTNWNGVPIGLAVQRMADQSPAGNAAARWARGLGRMTMRTLTFSLPPDEHLVYVQYRPEGRSALEERAIALPWHVGSGWGLQVFRAKQEARSVCAPMAEAAVARQALWYREERKAARAAADSRTTLDLTRVSSLPHLFEFQHTRGKGSLAANPRWLKDRRHPQRRLAYVRIRSFDAAEDVFVEEFGRILDLLRDRAPDGLILDIRSNLGGNISAAERVLQFLTPKEIQPALFHFVNTSLTQEIVLELTRLLARAEKTRADLRPWIQDILGSVMSGDVVTSGRPLTPPAKANDTGQKYQGPVALLVDARVYSAAEVFAAGFQDHAIGPVIGTAESTGGGGANRWLHDELMSRLREIKGLPLAPLPGGSSLSRLPAGASLSLAIRRASRVGPNAGSSLEDVGVKPDMIHVPTLADVTEGDRDLFRAVCARLGKERVYELDIHRARVLSSRVDVVVTARNVDRLECFIDGHPQCAISVGEGGIKRFPVPLDGLPGGKPKRIVVRGYARGRPGEGRRLAAAAEKPLASRKR
ncbi:MAG: S41 family peptidase [Bryobacter sp.]|jgi:hypothetical protein|nr:S41 family peptidase [Bryobacter sp.]